MNTDSKRFPVLSHYEDYRVYLRDVIENASYSSEKVSLQRFAEAFGLSRSHLSMVLKGDRVLTNKNIHRVAQALHFNQSDHETWEALVHFTQASDELERLYYLKKLDQARSRRAASAITSASRTLVSLWYIPALLVYLIDIGRSDDNLDYISRRIGVDISELNQVINQLQKEGFLSLGSHGDIHISFNRLTTMVSNKRFLKEVFLEGMAQLENNFDEKTCLFNATTFSLSENDIYQFFRDFKELLNKYLNSTGNGSQKVVQANIQFFPVL